MKTKVNTEIFTADIANLANNFFFKDDEKGCRPMYLALDME